MPLKDKEARAAYDRSRNPLRTTTPAYLKFKENRKEIYLDRKARQVCVECEAPLKPDDGLRCETCQDRHVESKERYERSPRGRRTKRKWQKRYYRKRRKRDRCVQCGKPRKEWPPRVVLKKSGPKTLVPGKPLHCPDCRTKANAAQKRYRDRKKQGIASLRAEQQKRNKKRLRELRGELYVPFDELIEEPRVKLMRALSRVDWITRRDLFASIGLVFDEDEPETIRVWNTHEQALIRIVERGHAVKQPREHRKLNEYKITEAGRAKLAELLKRSEAA